MLHAAATGHTWALSSSGLTRHQAQACLAWLLDSDAVEDNEGALRPFVAATLPVAQKNGWLRNNRHTVAFIYAANEPWLVVALTEAAGETAGQAQAVGCAIVSAIGLRSRAGSVAACSRGA